MQEKEGRKEKETDYRPIKTEKRTKKKQKTENNFISLIIISVL